MVDQHDKPSEGRLSESELSLLRFEKVIAETFGWTLDYIEQEDADRLLALHNMIADDRKRKSQPTWLDRQKAAYQRWLSKRSFLQ